MSKNTISVVVPYKNAEKWLERCCKSLKRQPGDFLFILVDDNSADGSREIAYKYCNLDQRFISMANTGKKGVSGARNTGLKYAVQSSDWVTFLDADDTLQPDAYKIFAEAIVEESGFNIYQFNHYRHYAVIGKTALKYTNSDGNYGLDNMPVLWCIVWNKLYRASFLKGLKFDEALQFGEDELFNLECLAKDGRIRCRSGVTTTHYFENKNCLSKTKTEADIFRQAQAITLVLKKHKDPKFRQVGCLRLSEHWSHLFLDMLTEK